MKLPTIIVSAWTGLAFSAAGFDVPRYAHQDVAEAKEEAAESGKPIAFVYSDPTST